MHLENSQAWLCTLWGHEYCTVGQIHWYRHSLQYSLEGISEQHSFSSVLETPTTPQGVAGKHCKHFPSVAEEVPGPRMWFFSMGERYELLLDSEKCLTSLFYSGKLLNLSSVSVFPPVKSIYLLERSTHLSSTSEMQISSLDRCLLNMNR